jgi:hypothetical protein
LLLIISATAAVSNNSIIPDQKAMAQVGGTTTNSTTGNAAFTNPSLLTYTNSTAGIKFSILLIGNHSDQIIHLLLSFISPAGGILGLQVSDIPPAITLAEETTAGINMLSKSFGNFNLTDSTPTTIAGGNPAQRIEYTAKQDQLDLRFIQVVTIKDGKEYIITFGAPKDQFQSDLPAVQQIIDSLQIINNTARPAGAATTSPSSLSSSSNSISTAANTTDLNTKRTISISLESSWISFSI